MFVGNLNYETTQQDLETLFSGVGPISEVFLPTDRATGQPRGFAFVEFTDSATVPLAIEKLDAAELKGRSIRVRDRRQFAPRTTRDHVGKRRELGGSGGREEAETQKSRNSKNPIIPNVFLVNFTKTRENH